MRGSGCWRTSATWRSRSRSTSRSGARASAASCSTTPRCTRSRMRRSCRDTSRISRTWPSASCAGRWRCPVWTRPASPSAGAELAFVALGSNVGDRLGYLDAARRALASLPDTEMVSTSDIEETAPVGPVDQPAFLNQMVALRTSLEPAALLARLQEIERVNGRVRDQRWGPRTLDLDIVRFGDRHIDTPTLVVPHPELPHRAFWQRELDQLSAGLHAAERR